VYHSGKTREWTAVRYSGGNLGPPPDWHQKERHSEQPNRARSGGFGKPAVKPTAGGAKKVSQAQSATKSEKTYLASPVTTETTNNTGLILPFEEITTRGGTFQFASCNWIFKRSMDPE